MQERDVLSRLIGDIYDAALDSSLWVPVLGGVREFAGGYSANLFTNDATSKHNNVIYTEGKIAPQYVKSYADEYIKIDPTTGRFFSEVGVPMCSEDFLTYDELMETRFYKEWVYPQRLVDLASAVLDKSATTSAVFGVFRHERDGRVDDEMRRKLRLVVPHLRRAVLVGRTIDLATVTAAGLADTLDSLSAGMFLVDDARGVVHANASGHAMMDSGNVVRAPGGRLAARDPRSDRELRSLLAAASLGDAAVGVSGIAQPLAAHDGESYVAHVMPLTSGVRRQTGKHYAAAAALFVHKAALQSTSAPEAIAKAYNLTPSELRVLLAIVKVGGVPETAAALGISDSTVKTHLQRVFSKTGTSRQADLARLVAEFSNPLVR